MKKRARHDTMPDLRLALAVLVWSMAAYADDGSHDVVLFVADSLPAIPPSTVEAAASLRSGNVEVVITRPADEFANHSVVCHRRGERCEAAT